MEMLAYYLRLSLISFKRSPALYLLVAVVLSVGVGAFVANVSLINVMMRDPIPEKSHQLYHVSMNTWPEAGFREQPLDITRYQDMMQILNSGIPTYTALTYLTRVYVKDAAVKNLLRVAAKTRATTPDFFNMMQVPFAYGDGFSRADAHEVVIGHELNETLFHGKNSIGKVLEVNSKLLTVVGVLEPWNVKPLFYHVESSKFGNTEDLIVPLELALDSNWVHIVKSMSSEDYDSMAESRIRSVYYLKTWVQLDNEQQKARLLDFLAVYCKKLRGQDLHPGPIINQLDDVPTWLRKNDIVDEKIMAFSVASFLFLCVCLLNVSGLLLTRYHYDAFEQGLKRSLGVSRKQIIFQRLIEALMLGILVSIMSVLLVWLFQSMIVAFMPSTEGMIQIEIFVVITGLCVSLCATGISAIYPAYQVGRTSIPTVLKG